MQDERSSIGELYDEDKNGSEDAHMEFADLEKGHTDHSIDRSVEIVK